MSSPENENLPAETAPASLPAPATPTPPSKKIVRPGKEGKFLPKALKFLTTVGAEELKKIPGGSIVTATAELLGETAKEENAWKAEERLNKILTASENAAATSEEVRDYVKLIGGLAVVMHARQEQLFAFLQDAATAEGEEAPNKEELEATAKRLALDAYRQSVLCEFEKVDRRGVGESKQQQHMALLPLDAVYVEPNLVPEQDIAHSREQIVSRKLEEEGDYLSREERRGLEDELDSLLGERWKRGRGRATSSIALRDALPSLRHAVILGGPGSGKSTLVRYTARLCARGELSENNDPGEMTPVVISLASYAAARTESEGLTLRQYIDRLATNRGGDVLKAALANELAAGRVFVLLDGVDEVPDAALRRTTVQAIETFLSAASNVRVLVTSRPIGYLRISGNVTHYTLPPFTEEQVSSFIHQWHQAVAPVINQAPEKSKQEAETMLAEIEANPQVSELATNPLMLVILTLLRSEGTKLPERRVQLYERVVRLLVDTWNELRRLDPATKNLGSELNPEYFIKILAAVAHWVRTERTDRVIRRTALQEKLTQILEEEGDETPEKTAQSYIDAASKRAGLLEECGHEFFVFWHPTFEEYLTARHFTRRPEQAQEKLWPYRHNPRFREIILLAIGDLSLRAGEKKLATEFVQALLQDTDDPLEPLLHRSLCLAADAVADKVGIQALATHTCFQILVPVVIAQPFAPLMRVFNRISRAYADILVQRHELFSFVRDLASDAYWTLRMEAARLASHAAKSVPAAKELCNDLLKDPDVDVRCHAACGLASTAINTVEVWTCILDQNVQEEVQDDMRSFLESHRAIESAVPTLLTLLDSDASDIRNSAAQTLIQANRLEEAVPTLLTLLDSDDSDIRDNAARTLIQANRLEEAVPTLLTLLDSDAPYIRISAARTLIQANRLEEAVPTLLTLLDSNAPYIRISAAELLIQANRLEEAVPTLLALLDSDAPSIRSRAAQALQEARASLSFQAAIIAINLVSGNPAVRESYLTAYRRSRPLTAKESTALKELFSGQNARQKVIQILFDWLWEAQQKTDRD